MCGIAGSVHHSLNIEQLTRDLYHRGPDEQRTEAHQDFILHHHRLAIVDIACGQQPMSYGNLTIIFNGEIYNHLDIRQKFDLRCETNSDTETILHLYKKIGASCMEEMDGMFAFAIYDSEANEIFLVRDRAGKKPLYYHSLDGSFVFASELNAIVHQLKLTINEQAVSQYIRMGYFYKSSTPYQDVRELPAGSYAIVSVADATVTVRKWWDINRFYRQRSPDSFQAALEKTDAMLHEAVRRRVESSDLEVGSFLSGGIDSGIVTAIAKQYNKQLKTFTVSFAGEYDEAPLARLVAERYQTDHHEIQISFDRLAEDIEKILVNYGEPFFDSSAIPSYYVSKAAKEHLTVILNGDGGDELFGGYRRYVPFSRFDFFRSGPLLRGLAGLGHALLPPSDNKKSKYNFMYRLIDLARKQGLETYLSATIDSFEGYQDKLITRANSLELVERDFLELSRSSMSGLSKIMNLDFDNILVGDLLVKMDIATMAHSLEGRSPLLSKELLEYIPGLPDNYKIRGGTTKFLLRKLSEKYLPGELINQPKRGFEIPLKKWIDGELKELISGYLQAGDALYHSYVDTAFVQKVWDRKTKMSDEKRAKIIWTLFALEVWYKKCFLPNA